MATTQRTTVKDTKETQNQVAQAANAEQRGATNRVPYISARIDRMSTDPNSKIKANASVTIGNHFAIHGLKVYDGGDRGLQVLYPGNKGTDNKFYEDFHPVTKEAREALNGYEQPAPGTEPNRNSARLDHIKRRYFCTLYHTGIVPEW